MIFIPLRKVCPSFSSGRLYKDRKTLGRAVVDDVTYVSELIKENNHLKSDIDARNNVLTLYQKLGDFNEEARRQFLSIIPFLPRNGDTIVLPSPIVLQQPFHSITTIEAEAAQDIINLWRMEVENQWLRWQLRGVTYRQNHSLCDKVILQNHRYTMEAAAMISHFLAEMTPNDPHRSFASCIELVNLTDLKEYPVRQERRGMLQSLCEAFADSRLVDVTLSNLQMRGDDFNLFDILFGKCSLRKLCIHNIGLGEVGMMKLVHILTKEVMVDNEGCVAEVLEKLHIDSPNLGPECCEAFALILQRSRNLEDIKFCSGSSTNEEGDIITLALDSRFADRQNNLLTKLDISRNCLQSETSRDSLCRALQTMNHLTHLNLYRCKLMNDGIEMVCNALNGNAPNLECLNLGDNEIRGADGARHISTLVQGHLALKKLCLNENRIESSGTKSIACALPSGIQEIQLLYNYIGKTGALALMEAYGVPEDVDVNWSELDLILLDGNNFGIEDIANLQKVFGQKLGPMVDNYFPDK